MSDDIKDNAGQQQADADAEAKFDNFQPKTPEVIRESVIKDFDLDPDLDKDKIEKLTAKEIENEKKFSTVLKQKQNYREKLEASSKKDGENSGLDIDTLISLQSEGYQPSEIKEIAEKAKKFKISPTDFLKDEMLMAGFKAKQAENKARNATPSPSQSVFMKDGKPVERNKMTAVDKQTEFEEKMMKARQK